MSRRHCILFATAALAPALARAQPKRGAACLDSIPESALHVAPVFLRPEGISDSTARRFRQAMYFFTQAVGIRLQKSLGASDGSIPRGEPAITWRDLDRRVTLTVYRDSSFTWTLTGDTAEHRIGGTLALMRAIEATRDAGEGFDWPPGERRDSLMFDLNLWLAQPRSANSIAELKSAVDPFEVFTVAAPPMAPTRILHEDAPHFPQSARYYGAIGTVVLSFVVDENGRVDTSSVVDEWPPERLKPKGLSAPTYALFVDAAKASLASAAFAPRVVGGCAVRSRATEPFAFCLSGLGCYGDKRKPNS